MAGMNRQQVSPVAVPRTRRNNPTTVLTSGKAGKCIPVAFMPLLREDSFSGQLRVAVEMQETAELIMNPVNCRVTAYVVPMLALERFQGDRAQFDRSYMGQPQTENVGAVVVPFVETMAFGAYGSNEVFKSLGLHSAPTDLVNSAVNEFYNIIWNFRAKNRSQKIAQRLRLDTSLAPAFWTDTLFEHVIPDFDQAVIDGEVALNVVSANLPLKSGGVAVTTRPVKGDGSTITFNSGGVPGTPRAMSFNTSGSVTHSGGVFGANTPITNMEHLLVDLTGVVAEMQTNGISVSLSNLAMAKKMQSFAKLRQKYEGLDDEYIIDMLMDGMSIPEMHLRQPILLADERVTFAQAKRYATDAGNLAESAVSGGAVVDISLRVPRLPTGGVIMVMVECLPAQLFERQKDWFFHSTSNAAWPEYVRDEGDPEKVDIVLNGDIDVSHATPAGTFGFEPKNAKYNRPKTRIGGKFLRPTANTVTDAERQRLWAIEQVNPKLDEDFYIAKNGVHQKPFLDTAGDPFEITVAGSGVIEGNTVFGGMLVEVTSGLSNYDKIEAQMDKTRIVKP